MTTTKISIFELGIIFEFCFRFTIEFFFLLLHNLSTNQVDEDSRTIHLDDLSFVIIWIQNQDR
jgi:hypothetical protein